MVSACVDCTPKPKYYYAPKTKNEVPAIVKRYSKVEGTRILNPLLGGDKKGSILEVEVSSMNDKVLFGESICKLRELEEIEKDRLASIKINPGANKIGFIVSGTKGGFLDSDTDVRGYFEKEFFAEPGEKYFFSGSGTTSQPSVWFQNSKGQTVFALSLEKRSVSRFER